MARIVALVGSPNESGNTVAIVNSILDGAMGLSTNTIVYHNLWKASANDRGNYILHCHDAVKPQIDSSMQIILDDIASSDVVIFGTPVYFDMPTSQFQLILEYMYGMLSADFSESILTGKKAIVAVSCNKINENSLNVVDTIVHSLGQFGIQVVDRLIYQDCDGPFSSNEVARKKALSVGTKFVRSTNVIQNNEVLRLNRNNLREKYVD